MNVSPIDVNKVMDFIIKVTELSDKEGLNFEELAIAFLKAGATSLQAYSQTNGPEEAQMLLAIADALGNGGDIKESLKKTKDLREAVEKVMNKEASQKEKADFTIKKYNEDVFVCSTLPIKEIGERVHLKYKGSWYLSETLNCGDAPKTHTHYIFKQK